MKAANWKLQCVLRLHLAVFLFLLAACQAASGEAPITPARVQPSSTPTQTATPLPPVIPGRIEFLSQLAIGRIIEMALSPEGERLAIASVSGIYLYGAETLELIWGSATPGEVTGIAWSGDGNRLGGVINQTTVAAWNADTGTLISSLEMQGSSAHTLSWLPDHRRLIWLAFDDVVHIWNPEGDAPVEIDLAGLISDGMGEAGPAAYTPDASLVAISGRMYLTDGDVTTGTVRPLIMMDVATGNDLYTLEDIGLDSHIVFSPDGSLVLTGSSVREPRTGMVLRTLEDYPDSLIRVAFSPDGRMVSAHTTINSSKDRVFVWDVATGELLHVLEGHAEHYPITAMTWSRDGSRLATGSMDKNVTIWDVKTGELLQRMTDSDDEILQLEFSADGNVLFVLSEDAHVVARDVISGEPFSDLRSASNISKLVWTTDSASVAVRSQSPVGVAEHVFVWDVKEARLISARLGSAFPGDLQFSPERSANETLPSFDGQMIASVESYSPELIVRDARTDERLVSLPVYAAAGKSIAWSPIKPVLSIADGTQRILIWNAETGERRELTSGDDTFWHVSWSTNGALLAATTPDHILLWDTATWNVFETLDGHVGGSRLAFSPDGSLLAAGSWDGVLLLWKLSP